MATNHPQSFSRQDVEVLADEPLYEGFFQMRRYRLRHRLFAGGWSDIFDREVFERGHAAVLLPYDPIRDEIAFTEQFRVGAIATAQSPWLLELVAGIIEEGETEEQVARRESEEESGLVVGRTERMLSYLASPGGMTERITIFVGEVDTSHAGGLHGLAEENEDIRIHVISREQAMLMLAEGAFDNAATIIGLQWLALNYESLRARWGV